MYKYRFVNTLAAAEEILQQDAKRFVDLVFKHIHKCILEGHEVRIDGVGKFKLKFQDSKEQFSNLTGQTIVVPAKVKIKFKTFPTMQEELRRLVNDK